MHRAPAIGVGGPTSPCTASKASVWVPPSSTIRPRRPGTITMDEVTQPRIQIVAFLLAAAVALPAQNPTATVPSPKRVSPTPKTSEPPGSAPVKPPPKPTAPYLNHNLVFLDPAHGGPDTGARLNDHLLEKDVTLALADRIRTLLAGNGVTVLLAREADTPVMTLGDTEQTPTLSATPTPDQRAGTANHMHAVACLLLHATGSGNGVHIVTSALPGPDPSSDLLASLPTHAIRWDSAQTDSIPQSLRLAHEIGAVIARANLPVHLSRASVKPIDSLTCPAVAVEIAPLISGPTQVSDPVYQQRVAEAIATALLFWRGHADPPVPPQPVTTPADIGAPSPSPGIQP